MSLREAAEMALEALESFCGRGYSALALSKRRDAAIKALRQALAQPDEVLAEREACALICESMERNGAWITKAEAAEAIRARGIDGATVGEVGIWGEK